MNMCPHFNHYYMYPPYYSYPNMQHPFYERYNREQMMQNNRQEASRNPRNSMHHDSDYGKRPFVVDIEDAAERNKAFRTTLWTGDYLQVTLMSIGVGDDVGLELHSDLDQFLRIEEGEGLVQMGKTKNNLDFRRYVEEDSAIFVPAGTWHNLINTGNRPLKLYSIYAPPEHPHGTVHETKEEAVAAEEDHYY